MAALPQGEGCWRDGKVLVMSRGFELPERCVRCNEPAPGYRLRRDLSWHEPMWALTLLISPLLYVLVALVVRKKARVYVSLCPEHRNKRTRGIAIAWLLGLAAVGLFVYGVSLPGDQGVLPVVASPILLIAALIWGQRASAVIAPKRIDKEMVWIKKVHPKYLAEFPDWVG
jgi:hypothetical protein